MLKLGKLNINNAYLGSTGVQKMYLGADLVWGGEEPDCYAIADTLAEYTGDYPWLWVDSEQKWYIRNEQNTYEPYGVYADTLDTTTYKGKLAIVDGVEYEWDGNKWVNVGMLIPKDPVITYKDNIIVSGTYQGFDAYTTQRSTEQSMRLYYPANGTIHIYGQVFGKNTTYTRNTYIDVFVNNIKQTLPGTSSGTHTFGVPTGSVGTYDYDLALNVTPDDEIKIVFRKATTLLTSSNVQFSLGNQLAVVKEYKIKEAPENPMVFDTVAEMEAYGCVFVGMTAVVGDDRYFFNGDEWLMIQEPDNVVKFTTMEAGTQRLTFGQSKTGTVPDIHLEYSTDGLNWKSAIGATMVFGNGRDLYMRVPYGYTNTTINDNTSTYYKFEDNEETSYSVSGNIAYLLNKNGIMNEAPANSFAYLFAECRHMVDASKLILPATTLASGCYQYMFNYCTSLINAPELPATTLASGCYYYMFRYCSKLINAPELPATTLAISCYEGMFWSCTSLINAPELPATTLTPHCYYEMFSYCNELINAPELPATTLASGCYQYMFNYCSSLVKAPELPATTLASGCYSNMFRYCSKLTEITMLATDVSAMECLYNWVEKVASTGTFTCASGMSAVLPSGTSGIPTDWTVVEAS